MTRVESMKTGRRKLSRKKSCKMSRLTAGWIVHISGNCRQQAAESCHDAHKATFSFSDFHRSNTWQKINLGRGPPR
jgi:hypothetical protein